MTLAQIADYADLIAALGVMLSILFVAYEMHQSNREAKLSNWRQLLSSLSQYKGLTQDMALSELIERGHADYHALTGPEKRTYGNYLEQGIHIIGNFSKHSGTIPGELKGLEGAIDNSLRDLLNHPGALTWWEEGRPKGKFMPQTYRNIDRILGIDGKGPA